MRKTGSPRRKYQVSGTISSNPMQSLKEFSILESTGSSIRMCVPRAKLLRQRICGLFSRYLVALEEVHEIRNKVFATNECLAKCYQMIGLKLNVLIMKVFCHESTKWLTWRRNLVCELDRRSTWLSIVMTVTGNHCGDCIISKLRQADLFGEFVELDAIDKGA